MLEINQISLFLKRYCLERIKVKVSLTENIRSQNVNLFYHLLNLKYTSNKDSLMVWAAMTLGFFGFLRIGELTCNSHFNPERDLSFSDLVFMPKSSPRYMLVQLKVSKTDPFRKGQTIVIGKANSHLCPLSAMLAYLESRTLFPTTGPLFTFQSASFRTRGRLTNQTRLLLSKGGLNSGEFAGHSFRIGAATTAASANLPLWLIKVLGRWSSDCFAVLFSTGSPDSHRAPVMSVVSIC